MYKAVVFDIDGTILPFGQKHLDADIINMFKSLKEKGLTTVLCTGREFVTIGDMLENGYIDYFIGSNGTFIFDIKSKKMLMENPISKKQIQPVLDFCDSNNINYSITTSEFSFFQEKDTYLDNWFWKQFDGKIKSIEEMSETENNIQQFTIRSNKPDQRKLVEKYMNKSKEFSISSKWTEGFFISYPEINKAWGLKKLGKIIDCSIEEMIAFGDGMNDLEMIKEAGLSFAMSDAVDEVKKHADEIIGSAEEMATIQKLEDLGLINK